MKELKLLFCAVKMMPPVLAAVNRGVSVAAVSAVCDQVDQVDQLVPAHQVDQVDVLVGRLVGW